jgi:hypothetical protein
MDETDSVSDWASRRKNIYLGALVFILSAVSFFIFWQFWYSTPTCFDNLKMVMKRVWIVAVRVLWFVVRAHSSRS